MFGRRSRAKAGLRIFISYRRADTAALVEGLRDHLIADVNGSTVFLDSHAIPPGDDFPEKIAREIDEADVVVALIGPDWLGAGLARAPRGRAASTTSGTSSGSKWRRPWSAICPSSRWWSMTPSSRRSRISRWT